MPRQVDHEARRRQIAAAVCRLVGHHGLEAVSLRHVAAEAGVSMGQVQHYFATKDEMLLFTFRTIGEHVEQRIADAVAGLHTPREVLRGLLVQLLPLDDAARAEAPVLAAFLARAVVHPELARSLGAGAAEMTGFIAERIGTAQQAGHVPAELDPGREATTLLALVDGLMMHLLTNQTDPDTALALIDYHLDRVFPDPHTGPRRGDPQPTSDVRDNRRTN